MKRELIYAAVIGGCCRGGSGGNGGGFGLAPLGAQSGTDGHFDEITCTDLKVMSPDGTRGVSLFARNGGGIFIYGKEEDVQHPFIPVVRIGADEDGGRVDVFDKDSKLCAYMKAHENGGRVEVYDNKDGKSSAYMSVHENGGLVSLKGKDGVARVQMSVAEYGGHVGVYGKDGGRSAQMSVAEYGGHVGVYGKDGGGSAQMQINKNGGFVGVYGRGNASSRALIGVNEHGNGGVSTWDKNGYRLANSEVRGNQMRNRLNAFLLSAAVHLVLILVASLFFDTVRASRGTSRHRPGMRSITTSALLFARSAIWTISPR